MAALVRMPREGSARPSRRLAADGALVTVDYGNEPAARETVQLIGMTRKITGALDPAHQSSR
ncbi:hypothetical protein ACTWPT_53330 [Nonomuraea sp. 3N208]|uniref:hypothetical protein n=1 Tax=Nonomuraea sp. 3N208 TaxID=3457421 RepID=UPI003FCF8E56